MPIRINLLAEAQALEAQRRRDPVKRLILAAVLAVILVLFWSSMLLMQSWTTKSDLARLVQDHNSRTNEHRQILDTQKQFEDGKLKLAALHRLATNRFLNGTLLDTLQKNTAEHVQLMRLKVSQNYVITADDAKKTSDAKPKPDAKEGAAKAKKPAEKSVKITEKTAVTLEAKDTSPAGDAYIAFQEKLSGGAYFQNLLGRTNTFRLASIGTPQTGPEGKTFVLFTLEARLPEVTR